MWLGKHIWQGVKEMGCFSRYFALAVAVSLSSGAQAQKRGDDPRYTPQGAITEPGALIAQTPPPAQDQAAVLQALQAAIDTKDTTAIFNILNSTPKDQRGPLATLFLTAAQGLQAADKQFAGTLAALACSGEAPAQQTSRLLSSERAGGLAIANTLV
jgi:hypothetical protein